MYDPEEFLLERKERQEMELNGKPPGNVIDLSLAAKAAHDQKLLQDFVTAMGWTKCLMVGMDLKGQIMATSINSTLLEALGMAEVAKSTHLQRGAK